MNIFRNMLYLREAFLSLPVILSTSIDRSSKPKQKVIRKFWLWCLFWERQNKNYILIITKCNSGICGLWWSVSHYLWEYSTRREHRIVRWVSLKGLLCKAKIFSLWKPWTNSFENFAIEFFSKCIFFQYLNGSTLFAQVHLFNSCGVVALREKYLQRRKNRFTM